MRRADRAKTSTPDDIRRMAEAILPVTRKAKVALVINDYPGIAAEVGAEFCHLGQEDLGSWERQSVRASERLTLERSHAPTLPRSNVPPQLGLSSHAPEQAQRAIEAGAAYIAIGPVYPTATKPSAKAVTLEYVRWAAANVTIPWFAIGGITLDNLEAVLDAGAKRICVVSAVLNSKEIAGTCQQFKQRLLCAR